MCVKTHVTGPGVRRVLTRRASAKHKPPQQAPQGAPSKRSAQRERSECLELIHRHQLQTIQIAINTGFGFACCL